MTTRCKNKDCSSSTGICGSITFGYGDLDDNGYWEFPCETCAKAFDEAEVSNYDSYVARDTVKRVVFERITIASNSEYGLDFHEKMQKRLGRRRIIGYVKNGLHHVEYEGIVK